MPISKNEISSMIMNAFPDATVELQDTAGDKSHYTAKIVSTNCSIFTGVPSLTLIGSAIQYWSNTFKTPSTRSST